MWFGDYNNHEVPVVRDYSYDRMHMQRDDAASYVEHMEEKDMRDIEGRKVKDKDNNDKRSKWQYWWRKYRAGKWDNFPDATYKELPNTRRPGKMLNLD